MLLAGEALSSFLSMILSVTVKYLPIACLRGAWYLHRLQRLTYDYQVCCLKRVGYEMAGGRRVPDIDEGRFECIFKSIIEIIITTTHEYQISRST